MNTKRFVNGQQMLAEALRVQAEREAEREAEWALNNPSFDHLLSDEELKAQNARLMARIQAYERQRIDEARSPDRPLAAIEPPTPSARSAAPSPLDRLVGVLRDWAERCGEALTPITPLAQPMSGGAATDPGEAHYQLGGRVRLRLRAAATPPFVQVRLERLPEAALLRVEWREAGELLLKAPLDSNHPTVDVTVDPGRPSELTLADEAGAVLARFPLGRADE